MADWTYTTTHAEYPYKVSRTAPPVLITRYEDGTEHRRQKHSSEIRHFVETYNVNQTTLDAMLDFWESKGLLTSFTKVSYDANESSPSTHEVTVRFEKAPEYSWIAVDLYQITFHFVEVL